MHFGVRENPWRYDNLDNDNDADADADADNDGIPCLSSDSILTA